MKLRSGVAREYRRGFLVSKKTVQEICSVLYRIARGLGPSYVVAFHLEREDSRFFETKKLLDIFLDKNVKGKRISFFQMKVYDEKLKDDDTAISIQYNIGNWYRINESNITNIVFSVSLQDNKQAILIADELEPYISATFNDKRFSRIALSGAGIVALYAIGKLGKYLCMKYSDMADVIDLATLLFQGTIIALSLVFFILDFSELPLCLRRCVGPEAVFFGGQEENSYSERERLRNNFFWTVCVAMVVSITATLLFL